MCKWTVAQQTRSGVKCGDLWFSGEHYMIHGPNGLYVPVPVAGQHNHAEGLAHAIVDALNAAKVTGASVRRKA